MWLEKGIRLLTMLVMENTRAIYIGTQLALRTTSIQDFGKQCLLSILKCLMFSQGQSIRYSLLIISQQKQIVERPKKYQNSPITSTYSTFSLQVIHCNVCTMFHQRSNIVFTMQHQIVRHEYHSSVTCFCYKKKKMYGNWTKDRKKNAPCNADKHVFHFLGKRFHSPQIVIYCKPTKETKNVQKSNNRQCCKIEKQILKVAIHFLKK